MYFIQLDTSGHNEYALKDVSDDAARYERTLHAIYKRHNLPHDIDLAEQGRQDATEALLTEGPITRQIKHQAEFKANKPQRRQIRRAAHRELQGDDFSPRQQSICSNLRLHQLSLKPPRNIGMMVLGGFITALGIASVAIAFTLLSTGLAGAIMAGAGLAGIYAGLGLFCKGMSREDESAAINKVAISLKTH